MRGSTSGSGTKTLRELGVFSCIVLGSVDSCYIGTTACLLQWPPKRLQNGRSNACDFRWLRHKYVFNWCIKCSLVRGFSTSRRPSSCKRLYVAPVSNLNSDYGWKSNTYWFHGPLVQIDRRQVDLLRPVVWHLCHCTREEVRDRGSIGCLLPHKRFSKSHDE